MTTSLAGPPASPRPDSMVSRARTAGFRGSIPITITGAAASPAPASPAPSTRRSVSAPGSAPRSFASTATASETTFPISGASW